VDAGWGTPPRGLQGHRLVLRTRHFLATCRQICQTRQRKRRREHYSILANLSTGKRHSIPVFSRVIHVPRFQGMVRPPRFESRQGNAGGKDERSESQPRPNTRLFFSFTDLFFAVLQDFVDGLEIPQLLYRVGVGHDHFLEALLGGPVFALPIIEPADVVIMGHNTLLAFEELFLGLPGVLGFGEGLNEPLKGLDGQACFLLVSVPPSKSSESDTCRSGTARRAQPRFEDGAWRIPRRRWPPHCILSFENERPRF